MPGLVMMELDPMYMPLKQEEEELLDDDGSSTYKPRPRLPEPAVSKRPLKWLIQNLETQQIDVDPEYQREVVWTADRMTGLVNSLMENYYIPPIILSRKDTNRMVCVDGKQRLSSVRAFKEGLIPCNDHRGDKWWFIDQSPGGKRKVLSDATQQQFLEKGFVLFEYEDLTPEQEEDLFARVQMGVQLSAAEKLRASTGPWQELARMFVDDFPVIFTLLKDCSRAKDFQIVLSCFSQIIEVQNPSPANGIPALRTNHYSLPKLVQNKDAVDDGIKSHLASVFTTFRDLVEQDPDTFTNADKRLRGVQTFAPIEFIAVACLISQYSDTRNNRLLLGDILALREYLRERFVDLRANAPTWKHIWDFIDGLEGLRGAVNGTAINRDVDMTPASKTPPTTVQHIVVASAVPVPVAKKGRSTARTKPTNVAPGATPVDVVNEHKPTAVKLEEVVSTPQTHPPRKRQKSGQIGAKKQKSSTSQPIPSGAGSSTDDPVVLDDSPMLDLPLHHKKPTPPTATMLQPPKAQKARRSVLAPPAVRVSASKPGSGRALIPDQARRERMAAYSRNAHNAQMAHPATNAQAPSLSTDEKSGCTLSTTSQAGDYAHNPVAPPRPEKSTKLGSQVDGAIDLTADDVEQERQSLLTQFSASKTPKTPAASNAGSARKKTLCGGG